jgi:hypothetical protein
MGNFYTNNASWCLPTGRTVAEFLDAQQGNLRHDAEYLIGQIRQGHQTIRELKADKEMLEFLLVKAGVLKPREGEQE